MLPEEEPKKEEKSAMKDLAKTFGLSGLLGGGGGSNNDKDKDKAATDAKK